MASIDQHCLDCKNILGEEFRDVHIWLDEMHHFNPGDVKHRCYRHNKQALEIVKEKFGDKSVKAAMIHIIRDFPTLGKIPDKMDYAEFHKWMDHCDFLQEDPLMDIDFNSIINSCNF